MNEYQKLMYKKSGFEPCTTCEKMTSKKELESNAQFGGYGFKMICDICAEKIEDEMDEQQGN